MGTHQGKVPVEEVISLRYEVVEVDSRDDLTIDSNGFTNGISQF
jgi:hypothetical protein